MATIEISQELEVRLKAIAPLIQSLVGDPMDDLSVCAAVVMERGLQQMLVDLLGQHDSETLVKTIQLLSDRAPGAVYGFLTEMWQSISDAGKEEARHRMGFHPPRE